MKSATKALKKGKRFYKKRKFIKEKEKLGVNLRPEKFRGNYILKRQ
jgi:hypothetical protein